MLKLSRALWKKMDGLTPAQRFHKQAAEIQKFIAAGYTMTVQGGILRFTSGRNA